MYFKRTLALLLAMVMVFGMCPTTALAAESGDWEYTVNDDGTATIEEYLGDDGSDIYLTVPGEIDGYTVTAIAGEAFSRCEFGSLTLPGTLTAIADGAFKRADIGEVYFDGTPEQWEALLPNIGTTDNGAILNASVVTLRYSQIALGEAKTADIYPYGNSVRYSFAAPEDGFYCLFAAADTDAYGYSVFFGTAIEGADTTTSIRTYNGEYIGEYTFGYLEAGTEAVIVVRNDDTTTRRAEVTLTKVDTLESGSTTGFSTAVSGYSWVALHADQAGQYTAAYSSEREYCYPVYDIFLMVGGYSELDRQDQSGIAYQYMTMEEDSWLLVRLYNNHGFDLSGEVSFGPTPPITYLEFGNDSLTGMVGDRFIPMLYRSPADGWEALTFTVEDGSVATVESDGISCTVELVGIGETTLTVTSASGASDSITITAWAPEELAVGVESPVDSLSTYEHRYYSFTAPETATYSFRIPMTQSEEGGWYYPELRVDSEASRSWLGYGTSYDYENGWLYRFYHMEQGGKLVFSLFNNGYSLDLTAAVMAAPADPVTQIIPNVTQIRGLAGTGTQVYASFAPVTAMEMLTFAIEDETVAEISDTGHTWASISLLAVGQTSVTVTCGDLSVEIPITVVEPTPITPGSTYGGSLGIGQTEYYTFTAETEGAYFIYVPNIRDENGYGYHASVSVPVADGNWESLDFPYKNDGRYCYYRLDAGTTLTFAISNSTDMELTGSYVRFDEAPAIGSVELSRELTGMAGESFYASAEVQPVDAMVYLSYMIADEAVARINGWSNNGVSIELLAQGETTLTVTNAYGGSWEFPITVSALPELTLDENFSLALSSGEYSSVCFTAPSTGLYRLFRPYTVIDGSNYSYALWNFRCDGYGTDVMSDYLENGQTTIFYLEAGTKVTMELVNQTAIDLDSYVVMTVAPGMESFRLNNSSMTMLEGGTASNFVWSNTPGGWTVVHWAVEDPSVVEITGSDCRFVYLKALKVGATNLIAYTDTGLEVVCPVTVVNPATVTLNEACRFTVQPGVAAFFHFTAPADGIYAVKAAAVSTENDLYHCDLGYNTYTGGDLEQIGSQRTELYNYCYYRMTAGTTVTLVASNSYAEPMESFLTVEQAQEATGMVLVPQTIEGKYGSYHIFRLQLLPEGGYIEGWPQYTIGDTSLVRMNWQGQTDGQLYLMREGQTTLTATWGDLTATAAINVTGDTKLELNQTYTTSLSGMEQEQLLFTAPADGLYTFFVPSFYVPEYDSTYCCNIWDNGIVDDFGSYEQLRNLYAENSRYLIYRLSAGTTLQLSLHNQFGFEMATAVRVYETPAVENIFFDTWRESGTAGEVLEFTVGYNPSEAYGQITFSLSGDPEAAVIADQGIGWCDVRLLKAGTVTLTATCGTATASRTITVTEPKSLTVEQPLALYLDWDTSETLRFTFPETGVYMFSATGSGQGFDFWDNGYTGDEESYIWGGGSWSMNTYRMFIGGSQGESINLELASYMPSSYTVTAVKAAPQSLAFTTQSLSGTTGNLISTRVVMTPDNGWGQVTFSVADPEIADVVWTGGTSVDLKCRKAGSTTLTATCGGLTASIPVTVSDPRVLTAGTPMTLELPAGARETLAFTYPDSGMYVFQATGSHSDFDFWYDDWTGSLSWGGSFWNDAGTQCTRYLGLDANETMYLILENYGETAASFTVSVMKATEPTGLALDCDEIVGEADQSYRVSASFLPASSGFGQVSWEIADTSVAQISSDGTSAYVYLAAPGKTTLTASCGNVSVTIPITVKAPPSFQVGQSTDISVAPGGDQRVLFTAPETGIYAIRIPYMRVDSVSYVLSMNLGGCSGGTATMLTSRGGEDGSIYFVEMTQGTEATFYLNNWSSVNVRVTADTVKAAPPTSLQFYATEIRGVPGASNGTSVVMGPDTAWGTLTWSVADESVAKITYSGETHCEFELLKVGQTTLTVSCGEVSASIPVIVESPAELKLNETADVTLDMDNYRAYFSFTAPTTGIYCFKTPVCTVTDPEYGTAQNACSIYLVNESELAHMVGDYTTDDFGLSFARIEGGTTVLLGMNWMMFGSVDTYITALAAQEPEGMILSQTSLTLLNSEESGMELYALLNPVGAYGEIQWSIEGDAAGIGYSYGNYAFIYPKALGTATVTATCGSFSASCTVNVVDKLPVVVPGYGSQYDSLSEALADAEGYLALTGNVMEDLVVSKDSYLDLNGHDLEGNVTIEEGATLYVFDSATADYTANRCGAIIGTVTGDLAKSFNTPAAYGHNYKYLALEVNENVWTFHRYYLTVKSVVLAPCMEGEGYTGTAVNYKTVFKCNDMVAEYVTAYGAKLTGDNTVYTDYLAAGYTLKSGVENARTTSLEGTLKTSNTAAQNAANGALAPTARAYITLSDGTELVSAPVTRSLRDMAQYANGREDLTDRQKQALGNMYHLFKASMDTWTGVDIGNIQAYAAQYFGTEAEAAFAIIGQPESVTAAIGSNAVFSVLATGEGLTYQWQFNAGYDWSNTTNTGYNTPALTVEAKDYRSGYQYRCVITDANGEQLISGPAILTVG